MSPSKRTFDKYKHRGVFSEFYGILSDKAEVIVFPYLC